MNDTDTAQAPACLPTADLPRRGAERDLVDHYNAAVGQLERLRGFAVLLDEAAAACPDDLNAWGCIHAGPWVHATLYVSMPTPNRAGGVREAIAQCVRELRRRGWGFATHSDREPELTNDARVLALDMHAQNIKTTVYLSLHPDQCPGGNGGNCRVVQDGMTEVPKYRLVCDDDEEGAEL